MLKTYDTQDAVPEPQRATAVETKDGKWAAWDAPDPALGDAGKAAIEAERVARRAAEKIARDATKRAEDLTLAQQARDAKIPDETLEQWKQDKETAVAAERANTDAALKKLEAKEIGEQFLTIAKLPDVRMYLERLDADMTAIVTKRFGLSKTGKLVVKDDAGNDTLDDPKVHLLSLKPRYPFLFRGDDSDGSGSQESVHTGSTGFDPVAAGRADAARQKHTRDENSLAFR